MGTAQTGLQTNLYAQSQFIQTIIDHYDLWFALPALAIVIVSFFQSQEE